MQISMTGPDPSGHYWLLVNKKEFGPFASMRDASWTGVMMVTDRIKELHGNKVYFLGVGIK